MTGEKDTRALPVVMGATMNVFRELFNSLGDTTRHGLMFLISSPRAGLSITT